MFQIAVLVGVSVRPFTPVNKRHLPPTYGIKISEFVDQIPDFVYITRTVDYFETPVIVVDVARSVDHPVIALYLVDIRL